MVPSLDSPDGRPFASARSAILVVEDELLIRLIVSEALREAGYDVIEAFNADEALEILRSSARVDLVISDVRMPGSLDGLGLLAHVRATFPRLPVILTSGHLDPTQALSHGATQFLSKPYGLDAVVTAVRNELARPS